MKGGWYFPGAVCAMLLTLSLKGQPPPDGKSTPLSEVLERIQKAPAGSPSTAAVPTKETARIADDHLKEILAGAASGDAGQRRLAALLLAYASPAAEGRAAVIRLAGDPDLEVQIAALRSVPAVANESDAEAVAVVTNAVRSPDKTRLVREGTFAASQMKLKEVIPILEEFLQSRDPLRLRYAAQAAAKYGPAAAPLLKTLERLRSETSDVQLKVLFGKAIAAATLPAAPASDPESAGTGKVSGTELDAKDSSGRKGGEPDTGFPGSLWITLGVVAAAGLAILIYRYLSGRRQ
jgi:hypothetical protein